MASFFLSPFLLLALLFGGGDSLTDYLNPKLYWEENGVPYELAAMAEWVVVPPAVDEETIRKWVGQLGADAYADRNAASLALSEIGARAKPQLAVASRSPDPEVSQRAKKLLSEIEGEAEQVDPMKSWMAVYTLSRMEEPAAGKLLQEIAAREPGELQALAADLLAEENASPELPPAGWYGFPKETRMLIQMRPFPGSPDILQQIHNSPAMQAMLVEILKLSGDVQLHRVTMGLSQGVFIKDNPQVLVRLEMSYDPKRMAKALGAWGFEAREAEVPFYRKRGMEVYLAKENQIILNLNLRSGEEMPELDFAALTKQQNADALPEKLVEVISNLPESALLIAATLFSEEMAAPHEGYTSLRHAGMFVEAAGDVLKAKLTAVAASPEGGAEMRESAVKEQAEVIEYLKNENEDWLAPMIRAFEGMVFSGEGASLEASTEVSAELLSKALQMTEREMSQHRQVEQRQEQIRIQRGLRIQQMRMNNGRVIF